MMFVWKQGEFSPFKFFDAVINFLPISEPAITIKFIIVVEHG